MTDEERLNELLAKLSKRTGNRLRFKNDVAEFLGPNPTFAEQIKVAEKILAEPCRGWVGGVFEAAREARLRREQQDG